MDEQLLEHHNILDGQVTPTVKEGAKHIQFLNFLSPYLVDVR
jgi:hypothetical protein